jgi:hypothetical protein
VPIGIAEVDRIIIGIGIAVDVDAGEDGVPGVGGEEAGKKRTCTIDVIGSGVAIGIVADSGSADACRCVGPNTGCTLRGIDKVGISRAEAGVVGEVIGIVTGKYCT